VSSTDNPHRFVHLHVHSPFSFLDGAARLEALLDQAAADGCGALALTDHDNVCAAVQFTRLAEARGIKPLIGAEVTLKGGDHLVLLADGPTGYARLCRLLTRGHLESPRLQPRLALPSPDETGGLICLSACRRGRIPALLLRRDFEGALRAARRLRDTFGPQNLFLELIDDRLPGTRGLNRALCELAARLEVGLVASNNVHYATRDDFELHDLLTCVRTGTSLADVHPERRLNAENWLKPPAEMAALFAGLPRDRVNRALAAAGEIADRCRPALELNVDRFPSFRPPGGETPEAFLRRLTYAGARRRYGRLRADARRRLEHELDIICTLGYAGYFLLVWDVARFARRQGIRYAGRGSAADSAVAYCLHLTEVDAIRRGLLFERFLSRERAQYPDIDIDFDAARRDEVADYVYRRHGRDRVAAVCTYSTYRARSALRDFGKAFGFDAAAVDRLARRFPYVPADAVRQACDKFPELREAGLQTARLDRLFAACEMAAGFPRHLGTHLGGLVIGDSPLTDITPLQRSAKGTVVCQFDKEGVEDLGLVKLDLLSLRALTAVELAVGNVGPGLDYSAIPPGDRPTYEMINRGDTVGVFQLESPAQRVLQARLGATGIEDLVASVALIRPGPVKGNMVEPFVARRRGREPVSYPHPSLEPVLERTYGVVLFQEQVIQIAAVLAGFSAGEADQLRRVMTHGRSRREMEEIGARFVAKATARGVDPEVASTVFSYMAGYAGYGFCEAHAAAFADTAYRTAYLVRHHPAEFYAALLSCQPMGYYPPDTLAVEARRRGVRLLLPDINRSRRWFTVERPSGDGDAAIRVSLRQVRGLDNAALEAIETAGREGPFASLADLRRRVSLPANVVENLILCGALDGLHPGEGRRALLWRMAGPAKGSRLPAVSADIPDFSEEERFWHEYDVLGMQVRYHWMARLRPALRRHGFVSSAGLRRLRPGSRARVAGFPVRPHRPPTRSGRTVVFLSIQDEAGLAEVTAFEAVYRRCGAVIFDGVGRPLDVTGRIQRRGRAVNLLAEGVAPLKPP